MCGYTCSHCGRCQGKFKVNPIGVCPRCGHKNDTELTHCSECGAPLPRVPGAPSISRAEKRALDRAAARRASETASQGKAGS